MPESRKNSDNGGDQDGRAEDMIEDQENGKPGSRNWDLYRDGMSIFDSLANIQEFAFILDIPPVPEVSSSQWASSLATALYSSLIAAIDEAGFFHEDEVKLGVTPGRTSLSYDDDRYDFTLTVSTNTISIGRHGSKFRDFHDWYTAFTPRLPTLIAGVLDVLRSRTERECRVFRGAYNFHFLLHDLQAHQSLNAVRNYEIMRKVVSGVPDNRGFLSEGDEAFRQASRIDVNMTRWAKLEQGWRLERYKVEAPANKEGAGLWLHFAYGGETYTDPATGKREPFEHRAFVAEYHSAYWDFLRDKAIQAFLTSLLRGYTFRTSAGNLP